MNAQAILVQKNTSTLLLEGVMDMLQSGEISLGMYELGRILYDSYAATSSKEWEGLVRSVYLQHPIMDLLMQDPVTARSFTRPRGYAGDAALLDMIYFPEQVDLKGVRPLGKKFFEHNSKATIQHALRNRNMMVTRLIDEVADNVTNARVLSVACGHCREADHSEALQNKTLGSFVGLDQDPASLQVVDRDYEHLGLDTRHLNIVDIVKKRTQLGKFDLIYSAGLYDYLSKHMARRLTSRLYDMLTPGGKLVLFNIVTDYEEIGYVESYLNWSMIGRNKSDMLELVGELHAGEMATIKIGEDDKNDTYYYFLEVTKK